MIAWRGWGRGGGVRKEWRGAVVYRGDNHSNVLQVVRLTVGRQLKPDKRGKGGTGTAESDPVE